MTVVTITTVTTQLHLLKYVTTAIKAISITFTKICDNSNKSNLLVNINNKNTQKEQTQDNK